MSYLNKNIKFRIELSTSVDYALDIKRKNSNAFWEDEIAKEIKDRRIAFKCLNPGESVPLDYKWIKCHITLGVNIEDFHRKA